MTVFLTYEVVPTAHYRGSTPVYSPVLMHVVKTNDWRVGFYNSKDERWIDCSRTEYTMDEVDMWMYEPTLQDVVRTKHINVERATRY